ncbi:polysaccharide deacetylase family protein [Nakamurella sp. GG22]
MVGGPQPPTPTQPICLTFDNGPEPDVTPFVLETLARRGILTTFFTIGEKLRDPARRNLAARARAEGHGVGNHTLTHGVPLGRRGGAEAVHEIAECDALLGPLREPEKLFRPNGGGGRLGPHLLNASAARYLQDGAHTVVLWNAVPRDYEDPDGWPDRAIEMHAAATAPVTMVLHDLPNGAMRHLDRVLGMWQDQGVTFLPTPPDACVPMHAGRLAPNFNDFVSPDPGP